MRRTVDRDLAKGGAALNPKDDPNDPRGAHDATRIPERVEWMAAMYGAIRAMPLDQYEELRAWEGANITGDGRVSTSDWPGWEPLIGAPPWRLEEVERFRRD